MRLGGPVFLSQTDPEKWIACLQSNGYRAAYCPVDSSASKTEIQAYAAAARQAGIVIAEVGAWSNPLSPDGETSRKALEHCQKQLALADEIGAVCCVNIAGSCGQVWDGPHPDNLTRSTFERIVVIVRQIIDHADQLFLHTRQALDALFVIQANPKPEHRIYRDVLSGFYGEYLEDAPGVRDAVTVFGNCSDESVIEGYAARGGFGVSQVVMGPRHRLARVDTPEFSTDDMGGAPVARLRFGAGTRLYYFNLPARPELDPRSERLPLKVHAVMRRGEGRWEKVTGERIDDPLALAGPS